jgi:hypothetical protein
MDKIKKLTPEEEKERYVELYHEYKEEKTNYLKIWSIF